MSDKSILILVPHGGLRVPEELEPYTEASELEIFMSADGGANEIFAFSAASVMSFHMSRLFVDLNRPVTAVPPRHTDGVIKTETEQGRLILEDGVVPDHIAIANIIRRYYVPYHDTVGRIISESDVRLILECHTIPAVGSRNSPERDKPLPLARIRHVVNNRGKVYEASPPTLARMMLENLAKEFSSERTAAHEPFELSERENAGELAVRYSGRIPYLRLDISRSLFLTEDYFNPYYLKLDAHRLKWVRERVWSAVAKAVKRFGV